jgi:hypothetical protein
VFDTIEDVDETGSLREDKQARPFSPTTGLWGRDVGSHV